MDAPLPPRPSPVDDAAGVSAWCAFSETYFNTLTPLLRAHAAAVAAAWHRGTYAGLLPDGTPLRHAALFAGAEFSRAALRVHGPTHRPPACGPAGLCARLQTHLATRLHVGGRAELMCLQNCERAVDFVNSGWACCAWRERER